MLLLLEGSITDDKNWPLLGMAVLALAYVAIRPMLRRRKDPLEKPFALKSLSQQRAVERSMQNLLVVRFSFPRSLTHMMETVKRVMAPFLRPSHVTVYRHRAESLGNSVFEPRA